jgi:hypothetical protein
MTYLKLNTDGTIERIDESTLGDELAKLRGSQSSKAVYLADLGERIVCNVRCNLNGRNEESPDPNPFFPAVHGVLTFGNVIVCRMDYRSNLLGMTPEEVQTAETALKELLQRFGQDKP